MTKQLSLTKYEREILPSFRDNLNKAESTEDIKKFFSYTTKELCERVFAGKEVKIYFDDISFEQDKAPFFQINERLKGQEDFVSIWDTSDLPKLLSNLAQAAKNRYIRLEKHFDKTEAKLRRQ